ncbi:hypothetical protein, partial [Tolypothrix sp. VBCCA 56010]|uniref:hypothetical protein n=1 Tax=Tolypothrix sp. VBCCA 56010 TaxID=3137731 RepID=UPI003D7E43F4
MSVDTIALSVDTIALSVDTIALSVDTIALSLNALREHPNFAAIPLKGIAIQTKPAFAGYMSFRACEGRL